MTKQEIIYETALELFKFSKADTIQEAFKLAEEFFSIGNINVDEKDDTPPYRLIEPLIIEEDYEAREERTKNRVEQLFNEGFEWDEETSRYLCKGNYIAHNSVNSYSDEEFEMFLDAHIKEVDESNGYETAIYEEDPIEKIEATISSEDIFKGKQYIEFEMEATICRLYKLEDKNDAEKDLLVSDKDKAKRGYIRASSDNEEHSLGITIYKK